MTDETPPPAPQWCDWTEDEDGNWASACGETWCFTEGGPKENRVKFCHGCGDRVRLRPAQEEK